MNNYCVICGIIIPEGRQVCPNCEDRYARSSKKQLKSCYYKALVGISPKCNHNCEYCEFWLPEPTE